MWQVIHDLAWLLVIPLGIMLGAIALGLLSFFFGIMLEILDQK